MILPNIARLLCIFLFVAFISSCTKHKHTNDEIIQAMNNYDSLIVKQNPAAIAQAFTPNGKLGTAAIGRDSIKNLLSRIHSFKVIDQFSTTTGIQIRGDSALQNGTYIQRNVNANHDTVKVMGNFSCKWKWIPGEGWKIANIASSPF